MAELHALARDLLRLIDTYLPLRPSYHDASTEIRDIIALFTATPAPARRFVLALLHWLIVQDSETQQAACQWLETRFALDLDAPIEELIAVLKPAPSGLLATLRSWADETPTERNEENG